MIEIDGGRRRDRPRSVPKLTGDCPRSVPKLMGDCPRSVPPPTRVCPSSDPGLTPPRPQGVSKDPTLPIAGWEPMSLQDYPGKLAAVVFLQGCNLSCPWCHNPKLIPETGTEGSTVYSEEVLLEELRRRWPYLDAVVISGGEPTVHPGLGAFIRRLHETGFLVKLDTNGFCPEVLEKLVVNKETCPDYVALDLKGVPGIQEILTTQRGKSNLTPHHWDRTLALFGSTNIPWELRCTWTGEISLDDLIQSAMGVKALLGKAPFFLQNCRAKNPQGLWKNLRSSQEMTFAAGELNKILDTCRNRT